MNIISRIGAALLALAAGCASAQTATFTRTITTQNLASTGDCTAGSCAVFDMAGKGAASVEVRGTYTASGGLSLRRSNTGVTWETVSANAFVPVGGTGTATITSAAAGTWALGACVGFRWCMVTALGAVTGTATLEGFTTNASSGGTTSVSGGAGDASASNQVTGNASLASIDTKTPALGQALAAAASPVVLPALQNAVNTQGSTTSGQSGALIQGAVTTSAPSYTPAQTSPLSLDTSGNLRVNVVTGGAGGGNVTGGTAHDAVGTSVNPVLMGGYASAAVPTSVSADGDAVRAWMLRSGAQAVQPTFGGVLASAGTGASGTGVQRVVAASDSPQVVTLGATSDAAAAADNSTASLIALLKRNNQNLTAQTAAINADPNYTQTPGSAVPTRGLYMGARGGANLVPIPASTATVPISMSTATTTQHVALSGSTLTYVTSLFVISAGTTDVTLVYGTGTNCGTGTTSLTGAMPLVANSGLSIGSGLGGVFVVPSGQALCITNSAGVQISGALSYSQY